MTGRPGGLLAVHAHPDDETLSTGALLATWAASGAPVTVVTCTRGERGEVIPPELAHLEGDGPALAAHRERELAAALAALGVRDHAFLDALPVPDGARAGDRYADSGMVWVAPGRAGPAPDAGEDAFARVPLDEAAGRLARLLRERRPDVVVGYEPGGGYGHPDHVQAHRVLMRAVELAADGATATAGLARDVPAHDVPAHDVPVVLWAAVDAEAWAAAQAALPEPAPGLRRPAGGRAAPTAAVAPAAIDLRVDVRPVLDRVVAALAAHATQVQGLATWGAPRGSALGCFALSDAVLQPLLSPEAYRVARGSLARVNKPVGVAG